MGFEAGTVVRFDRVRGYGFIAPDGGGEDVFLHANDLEVDKSLIHAGVRVRFGVEVGDRGMCATSVQVVSGSGSGVRGSFVPDARGGDDYYDVLSVGEFTHDVTELLLGVRPSLNAEQVLGVRERLTEFVRRHGWVDEG